MTRNLLALLVSGLCLCAFQGAAQAHAFRPLLLDLREIQPDHFAVLWKTGPMAAEGATAMPPVVPTLPADCVGSSETEEVLLEAGLARRWSVHCPEGLLGQIVIFEGLPTSAVAVLVRVEWVDGTRLEMMAEPGSSDIVLGVSGHDQPNGAGMYLGLGAEHIMMGLDHLCFVLALLLLVRSRGRLFWTITAFTAAHSLTLALTVFDMVSLPSRPVEAAIAASIALVAAEVVLSRRGRVTWGARNPQVIAFAFGLLHGCGFAAALREIGLPVDAVPLALLNFNIGVEAGQLAFVAVVLVGAYGARKMGARTPEWGATAAAYAMGSVAFMWMFERLL